MMRLACNAYKDGYSVYYFDSEGAVDTAMFESYGIPDDAYKIMPVFTVEQFRKQCSHIVDDYAEYMNFDPIKQLKLIEEFENALHLEQ